MMGAAVQDARNAYRLPKRARFGPGVRRSVLFLALGTAFVLGRLSSRQPIDHSSITTAATREAEQLGRSLDMLEARLTQGEALVMHQAELRRRHERVSALACTAAAAQQQDATRLARDKAMRASRRSTSAPAADGDGDGDDTASNEPPSLQGHALAARPPIERH
jgi:hypothetical protein